MSFALAFALPALAAAQTGGGFWFDTVQHTGQAQNDRLGGGVAGLDDVDGDGVPDYAIGSPGRDDANFPSDGVVEVYSGADHTLLYRVHNPRPLHGGNFGASILDFEDLDGDGVRDFVAASSSDQPAYYSLVSGARGTLIYTKEYSSPSGQGHFAQVARVADVDGDGIPELLAGIHTGAGGFVALSGADGTVLAEHMNDVGLEFFGSAVLGVEDYDGDGLGDWLLGSRRDTWVDELGRKRYGTVRLVSSASFKTLGTLSGEQEYADFGASLARLGDMDSDGYDEIAIGAPSWSRPGSSDERQGYVEVHSLKRPDTMLWRIEGDAHEGHLGSRLQSVPDVDGDGLPELLVAEPEGTSHGRVHLLSSWDGSAILVHDGTTSYSGDLGSTLGLIDAGPGQSGPTFMLGDPSAAVSGPGTGVVHLLTHDPLMTASADELSTGAGGSIDFDLAFPPLMRWAAYRILISGTGTGPVRENAVTIPLTPDSFFWRSRSGDFAGYAAGGFAGTLDSDARASARLDAAPGQYSSLSGRTLWFAGVAGTSFGLLRFSSVAVPVRFVP